MIRWLKIACCSLFLLLAPLTAAQANSVSSPAVAEARSTARSEIWQSISSGQAGSATVAILDGGRIVYSEGFAMADRLGSVPVTRHTLFNIGSISKIYCVTAILLLADEGKLELDQPVIRYLPEFTMADERYKKIAVRMLLNHSSGLPGSSYANGAGFKYFDDFLPETLRTLARSHLKHEPGQIAIYCNDGFSLAEMIIEKISGQKFSQFLAERIYRPLGLTATQTGVAMPVTGSATDIARYYDPAGKIEPPEVISFLASGGLAATAEDLARFVDSFSGKGPQLLSARSLAEIKAEQPTAFAGKLRQSGISYGLGWDFTSLPQYSKRGIAILGKNGGTDNYNSMVFSVPDQRITVAVIATGPAARTMDIALKILDTYLVQKGQVPSSPAKPRIPPAIGPIPAALANYEGYYAGTSGAAFKLTFDQEKNSLTVYKLQETEPTQVLAASYSDGYFHSSTGEKYYFTSVEGNRLLINSSLIDTVMLQRIEPVDRPEKLRHDLAEAVWLRRNVQPYESRQGADTHIVKSRLLPELPGYVDFLGLKRIDSPATAGHAFATVRDATELQLFDRDGETWAWVSGLIFMPAKLAEPLSPGTHSVQIGDAGFSEWLKTDRAVVLSFSRPTQCRVLLFAPDETILYDSIVDNGEVYAPAGSLIELVGVAGDIIKVFSTISQP